MSSLLALQTKDAIVFASDTALSATVKGKTYRVGNNENKLFEYGDFIMFASGKKYLRDSFISLLSDNPTINEIQEVLSNHILQQSEEYSLEVVIAMKDLSKLIFLSSTDGFEYSESLPNDYTNLFTAGYKTNEVSDKFQEYYQSRQLLQSLQSTYKDLTCNEIGGSLDVFILEKDSIRKLQFQIDDMKTYSNRELVELYDLVHANRLVGKIILSKKLHIEDEKGVVEIQSGIATFYDETGVARVYIGKYPSYENPNVFKTGIRVDSGSFEMRTSTSDKRGMQIDGLGIRTFNSNGVRTFNVDAQTGKVSIIGSLEIRTSTDNRGVVIDNNGIHGYNASGGLTFQILNNGNAWFSGRLEGATGTVDNLGGTLDNMGGSFVGSINSDGVFKGVTTGTLSAQTVDAINIRADQITSGKISSNLIDTNSLTAATIDVDQLRANGIQVNELSAITSNLGYITAGQIEIDTDMTIGNNLYIGSHFAHQDKAIIFGGWLGGARIDYRNDSLIISAMTTVFDGTVDFSRANVIGL